MPVRIDNFAWFMLGACFGVVLFGEILDALDRKQQQEQAKHFQEWYRSARDEVQRTADESTEVASADD